MKIKAKVVGRINIDPDQLVTLDHVRRTGEDYSQRKIMKFTAIGSSLERCLFANAQIDDASFGSGREMSEYIECSFDGMRFSHGGGHARFVRCSFRNVNLRDWFARSTEMIDCVLGGRLHTAIFCGRIPVAEEREFLGREFNEFHGNDFSALKMVDVNFNKGIDLTQQQLPSDPRYIYVPDAPMAVTRVQAGLNIWDANPELRRSAQIIADGYKRIVDEGQQQLFEQLDTYYQYSKKTFPREAIDKVFALLRGES